MSISLASIHIYPIKSLGGFEVDHAKLTDRGLQHDRRWMITDENGIFISQREIPAMACLHIVQVTDGFQVIDTRNGDRIEMPWQIDTSGSMRVQVWSQQMKAVHHAEADPWFSKAMDRQVQVVYMPDESKRRTDGRYAKSLNSFSDGFPYLIASQASLDDLNDKLQAKGEAHVPMDRFRPNLVIAGGTAFQEDHWKKISIGAVTFELVKPCARCVIVTTDQQSGARSKEPLCTLASYRSRGNNVLFAMNAVAEGTGVVRVGDAVIADPKMDMAADQQ